MRKKHLRTKQSGFSLTELIIAIVILLVGILPLLAMVSQMHKNVARKKATVKAPIYCANFLESLRSVKWDENADASTNYALIRSNTLGTDSTEVLSGGTCQDCDDIDDFDGYTDTPEDGYTRSVSVEYVQYDADNIAQSVYGSTTDFKRVTVSVEWVLDGKNRTLISEMVYTNGG